jgi:hypothetical protein
MLVAETEPPRRRGRPPAARSQQSAATAGSSKATKRQAAMRSRGSGLVDAPPVVPEPEPEAAAKADEYEEPVKGRPQEPAAAPVSEPDTGEPFPSLNVHELREMAEARGIEMPSGYVPRAELIKLLQEAGQATS